MSRLASLLKVPAACGLGCLLLLPLPSAADDWPFWRGPQYNGAASPDQDPPTTFSSEKNVLWSVDVPGKGHGSPTVAGEQVVLATADLDRQQQEVLCYARQDGRLLWRTVVHQEGLTPDGNEKATLASSTAAVAGDRVFINFLNRGAVYTTALQRSDGRILWRTKISDYKLHQGYGSSPIPFEDLLLVAADNKGGGAVAALRQDSGEVVWKHARPAKPNYPSPAVVMLEGQPRMIMTGCDKISCFEPRSGELLWEFDGATTECVTTTITDGERIFTSGGYPRNHVAAIWADGTGRVAWRNNTRVYVPSMLVRDGHLYAVADQGFVICWNSSTGEQVWKHRLPGGGDYTASPVLVGSRIYACSERGVVTVCDVAPNRFEILSQNPLADAIYATPAICDGRIYARVVEQRSGGRQERLFCLGGP